MIPDEKATYAIFRKTEGRCAHCRTRLKWDEFDVRGRSGGWVLEISSVEPPQGAAFCFRCAELPNRKKSGRLFLSTGFAQADDGDEEPPAPAPAAEVEES